ncbi:MAG: AMP-binding protein [Bdellovibrionota bacterium]
MERVWYKSYPKKVSTTVNAAEYSSAVDVFEQSVARYRALGAFTNMGHTMTYGELDRRSRDFAAYLQGVLGLKRGDRVALMMPNLLQYPVAVFGVLRAGLIAVNINPLYTPRELEHQLKDSGSKAIVVLANMAHTLDKVRSRLPLEHVIVTEVGDMLPFPKRHLINFVVRKVKKMVPAYDLPDAIPFTRALMMGAVQSFHRVEVKPQDLAFLQYTGGTTGVAKGAMLSHANMVANMQQISEWMKPTLVPGEEIIIAPLPLYHIFSLTVNCLSFMKIGGRNILITNPRDVPAFVKDIQKEKFTIFVGLNTLFNALCHNADFCKLDFSHMKASVAGGMAVQRAVNDKWNTVTGKPILEGYGLTETSPVLCCNPLGDPKANRVGTIGMPVPDTDIRIVKDDGQDAAMGEAGELWGKGPQVMSGYWQRPDESEKVLEDGWFKTGDIAIMEPDGYFKIVDRKKDMILVSGFNVYPNEIEDVAAMHPGILESAAIGVPDEKSGEIVKLFVVRKDPTLTEKDIIAHCRQNLTGYKVPKLVEFRTELPKSNVGKILRKELRN